jgi:1,4-dihydroxy-2-naphthoate octaprenyltransferase
MEKKESTLVSILRIGQPFLLLAALLTYTLGLGIAHYLAIQINWTAAILGSSLGIFILLARNYLSAFFTYPEAIPSADLSAEIKGEDPSLVEIKEIPQNLFLQIGLVSLAAGAAVTFVLMVQKIAGVQVLLALGLAVLLILAATVPPLRLERRGYGELIEALLICNLIPAVAFLLQANDVHAFLGILTFPLTFIYLSMRVALSLEYFGFATKFKTGTMLVQMGWQRAISMHNLGILLAFVLLGGFILMRLPWMVAWPILLAFPLAVFQIFLVQRIADGATPRWWLVRLSAVSTFAVMTYLTILTLWVH